MHNQREYIGTVDTKDLPHYARQAINTWMNYVTRTYQCTRWRQNYAMFFRYDEKSLFWNSYTNQSVRTDFVPLAVNEAKAIIKNIINMTYSKMPVMKSKSGNNDPKSLDHIEINDLILERDTNEGYIQKDAVLSGYNAYLFGTSFDIVEWDRYSGEPTTTGSDEVTFTGDVSSDVLTVLDVYFDCTKKRWEDLDWIIVRQKVNKYKIAANPAYADLRDDILSMKLNDVYGVPYFFDYNYDTTDDIFIYKFIHKPDPVLLPNGRYSIFLSNDVVLEDGENPYDQINVFPLVPNDHIYGVYGDTDCNDLYPVQKLNDALTGCLMTKITAFGIDKLFIENESLIDVESLTGGLKLFKMAPQSAKPVNVDLMGDLNKILQPLPLVSGFMQSVTGMNAAAMGRPDPSIKAAVAMSFQQSMAQQYNNTFQRNAFEQMRQKATFALKLRKQYATFPQLLQIVGDNKKFKLKRWTNANISMVDSIYIEPIDPVTSTIGGRLTFSDKLAQMGAPIQDYVRAFKTGSYEPLVDDTDNELNNIGLENSKIMKGEVPMAIRGDNHPLHRKKHKTILDDPETRKDKKISDAYYAHLRMHDEEELNDAKYQATLQATIQMAVSQITNPPPPPGEIPPGAPGPGSIPGAPPPRRLEPGPLDGNSPQTNAMMGVPGSGGNLNPVGDMPNGTI